MLVDKITCVGKVCYPFVGIRSPEMAPVSISFIILMMLFCFVGTSERVCLIVGTIDACQNAHEEISKIITEKPDPQPKPNADGDGKINYQRHNQVFVVYQIC